MAATNGNRRVEKGLCSNDNNNNKSNNKKKKRYLHNGTGVVANEAGVGREPTMTSSIANQRALG